MSSRAIGGCRKRPPTNSARTASSSPAISGSIDARRLCAHRRARQGSDHLRRLQRLSARRSRARSTRSRASIEMRRDRRAASRFRRGRHRGRRAARGRDARRGGTCSRRSTSRLAQFKHAQARASFVDGPAAQRHGQGAEESLRDTYWKSTPSPFCVPANTEPVRHGAFFQKHLFNSFLTSDVIGTGAGDDAFVYRNPRAQRTES